MVDIIKKYINQQDMKQANAAEVFRLIRENEGVTRQQLEDMTRLSWGAISNITARLIAGRYITEEKRQKNTGAGRIPNCLEVNSRDHFILGLDINRSGFKAVMINLRNEVVYSWAAAAQFSDRQQLLSRIRDFAQETLEHAAEHHIVSMGVAMQGYVDTRQGISIQFPHCRDWKDVPVAEILEQELGLPVFLEHDPNCILYAEAMRCKTEKAILLRVDNGIGMAVMMERKIFDSPGMFEIGHMCVVPGGVPCSCGKRGCLECYASKKGMEDFAGVSFDTLVKHASAGIPESVRIFEDMAGYLATAISNSAHLLNISNVLLCGDMFQHRKLFFDRLKQRAELMAAPTLNIHFSCIDMENAALGAALIAIDRSVEAMMIDNTHNPV